MFCRNCGGAIEVCTGKLGFVGDAIHVDGWFACDHTTPLTIANGTNAEYTDEDFAILRECFATKRLWKTTPAERRIRTAMGVDVVWDGTTATDLENSNG